MIKIISSGNDDNAPLGLRVANAVPTFAPISKALQGFQLIFRHLF